MPRLLRAFAAALFALGLLAAPTSAATPAENPQNLSRHIDPAVSQLQAGNIAGAQAEFKAFSDRWFGIEDGIRAQDRTMYRNIENHMVDVQAAFAAQPADPSRIRTALEAQQAAPIPAVGFLGLFPSWQPTVMQLLLIGVGLALLLTRQSAEQHGAEPAVAIARQTSG